MSKTGNWQKILRERIEGLTWTRIADKACRGLCPKLALSSGRSGRSGSYSD